VVVGSAYSRNPDPGKQPDQASFTFGDIAPGRYVVKIFHEGDWVATQDVEVPEDTEEVGVQISVPSDGRQHPQEETGDATKAPPAPESQPAQPTPPPAQPQPPAQAEL
jgi:hypothetical protein